MPETIAFIINPISGAGAKNGLESLIRRHIDCNRFVPYFCYTQYPGHATELASRLRKCGIGKIVAVGGDGTVNEIARGLASHDGAALGILPFGSGNGLARHLGIPMNIERAIQMLNTATTKLIDYGRMNDEYFFCTCGLGFDAKVGLAFANSDSRGFWTYVRSTIKEFFGYRPKKYKITLDGTKIKRRAFIVTIANAAQYGNNAYIAPLADIADGFFDVTIINPFPKRRTPWIGFRMFNQTLHKDKHVEIVKARDIVIRRKKKGPVHFDGEPAIMGRKIKVLLVEKGLQVLVPAC